LGRHSADVGAGMDGMMRAIFDVDHPHSAMCQGHCDAAIRAGRGGPGMACRPTAQIVWHLTLLRLAHWVPKPDPTLRCVGHHF